MQAEASESVRTQGKGTRRSNGVPVHNYSLRSKSKVDSHENDEKNMLRVSSKPRKRGFKGKPSKQKTENATKLRDPLIPLCKSCKKDKKPAAVKMFQILGCNHSYCAECIVKYVESKLQENAVTIGCPVSGCTVFLEPQDCLSILPKQVSERWGDMLCEAMISATGIFYCPFKDCSAPMLFNDRSGGNEIVLQSECPNCNRLFCAQCKVPWHSGITCDSFNKMETASAATKSRVPLVFTCEMCADDKPTIELFHILGCNHSYCSECIGKYVASKLQENITTIHCPVSGCNGFLQPQHCRLILPKQVYDRWGDALCEAVILASEKFYCPFRDCSALLINDRGLGGELIAQSECPDCNRLFCMQCNVPWHSGISCEDFQKLEKDERSSEDIMLVKLAKRKKWMRCSKCKSYVERSEGCLFMKCRCGYCFCYNCGAPLTEHYCPNCKH